MNLYRLYKIQTYNKEKIAIYVKEENIDFEILSDGEDIVKENITRKDLLLQKPWLYQEKLSIKKLTRSSHIIRKARKIIENNENVNKAIFVESIHPKHWRGMKTLYHNEYFDEIKSDTPQFSGCKPIGEIVLCLYDICKYERFDVKFDKFKVI